MRVRLATYNIHRCFGRDGRFDPGRIAGVLREIDADIVALQEVENSRHAGLDILGRFERETGMRAIAGPTIFRPDAVYGNAVLSRLPIHSIDHIELTEHRREARSAMHIRFAEPCRLDLLATHFGLGMRERVRQARRLCETVAARSSPTQGASMQGLPTQVIAGDINEWAPFAPSMRRLRRRFGPAPCLPTFPASLPLVALDRIMASPPERLLALGRHRSPLARTASDHLPLVAEIDCGVDGRWRQDDGDQ